MKILFSVPLLSYIADNPPILPDLGLGYLATVARKEGHTVALLDWNMEPSEAAYRAALERERPDVVGIKVFTKDVGAAARTIGLIKSVCPGAVLVAGGPHPSATDPGEIFDDLPGIDFAVRGEGEMGLPILLRYLGAADRDSVRQMPAGIPGLVWKKADGSVTHNPIQLSDIEKYELEAWDLIDPRTYPPIHGMGSSMPGVAAPFITSRGCPGTCTFCSVKLISGNRVRKRPIPSILAEMSRLYDDYQVRFLMIMDNGFLVDENFVQELCTAMIKKDLKFSWDCVLIDKGRVLQEKTVMLMKQAGCIMVNLGVESGSPKVRKAIHKANSLETIEGTVTLLKKHGIGVFAFFILGFPDETRADMKETFRFARAVDFRKVCFTICFPIPGTKVYEYLLSRYRINRIDWSSFDIHHSPYPCSDLSSAQLSRLARRGNIEFMLRKDSGLLFIKLKRLFLH
jgi:anaerobic magnesium-protoporphyrin IX monomethyl ester cyclase